MHSATFHRSLHCLPKYLLGGGGGDFLCVLLGKNSAPVPMELCDFFPDFEEKKMLKRKKINRKKKKNIFFFSHQHTTHSTW